jgi:hypothetical protein
VVLFTSTLMLFILALWSAADSIQIILRRRTLTATQRLAIRQRRTFLGGFAVVLLVIYAIYFLSRHH